MPGDHLCCSRKEIHKLLVRVIQRGQRREISPRELERAWLLRSGNSLRLEIYLQGWTRFYPFSFCLSLSLSLSVCSRRHFLTRILIIQPGQAEIIVCVCARTNVRLSTLCSCRETRFKDNNTQLQDLPSLPSSLSPSLSLVRVVHSSLFLWFRWWQLA